MLKQLPHRRTRAPTEAQRATPRITRSLRGVGRVPAERSARRNTRQQIHRIALTGTPGTGKSRVARLLFTRWKSAEVRDLALQLGVGRRSSARSITVDLVGLAQIVRRRSGIVPPLLVGHLSHLLPVQDIVVLRCHPRELARRLRRRRLSRAAQRENLWAEAIDLVLVQAIGRRPDRLWEIDTTRRSPPAVAREVQRLLATHPRSRYGLVDWLADPAVTEELLRGSD